MISSFVFFEPAYFSLSATETVDQDTFPRKYLISFVWRWFCARLCSYASNKCQMHCCHHVQLGFSRSPSPMLLVRTIRGRWKKKKICFTFDRPTHPSKSWHVAFIAIFGVRLYMFRISQQPTSTTTTLTFRKVAINFPFPVNWRRFNYMCEKTARNLYAWVMITDSKKTDLYLITMFNIVCWKQKKN